MVKMDYICDHTITIPGKSYGSMMDDIYSNSRLTYTLDEEIMILHTGDSKRNTSIIWLCSDPINISNDIEYYPNTIPNIC